MSQVLKAQNRKARGCLTEEPSRGSYTTTYSPSGRSSSSPSSSSDAMTDTCLHDDSASFSTSFCHHIQTTVST